MSDQSGIGRRPRFASQYRVSPAIFEELKSKAEATRRNVLTPIFLLAASLPRRPKRRVTNVTTS
jgi:hypothetical protein